MNASILWRRALAAGILSISLSGCGGGGGGSPATSALPTAVAADLRSAPPVPVSIVNANNSLGLQLITQMRKSDAGKNVFISPAGVALAMEMMYNGAAGTTQQAMAQALDLGSLSVTDMNSGNAALEASLVSTDPAVQMAVANSFWYYKANNQILPSFTATNAEYYGSQIGDLSGAPNNINAWISAQTNGKITNIVDEMVRNNVAALVNAVYFKGAWSMPFDPAATQADVFTLAGGTTVPCSMMHLNTQVPYYSTGSFQAVMLPYGAKRTGMLVFLPNQGVTADTVLGQITATNLAAWLPQFTPQTGAIGLPKFTSTYKSNLKPVFTALGMGIAFDPNNANFSNMGPALYIDSAVHETYLSVDEAGTEAAGATFVGIGATSVPVDAFTMTVNRPFVCAIVDTQTGEILFEGVIDSPNVS